MRGVSPEASSLNQAAAAELRAYLARQKLTIAAAAQKIPGKNVDWLSRRLNGVVLMTLDDIELICTALGIPVARIICSQDAA